MICKCFDGFVDIDWILRLSILLIIDIEFGDIYILLKMMHLFIIELEIFVFDWNAMWCLFDDLVYVVLFLDWGNWWYLLCWFDAETLLSGIQD